MLLGNKLNSKTAKNLKKFKKAKFNYAKFVRNYYMYGGEAYISAKVKGIDDIVSKYSIKDYEWINNDFANYVQESAYYIPVEEKIVIEICGCKFSDEEKTTIERVIKDYFGLKLGNKVMDLESNKRKSIFLLIFGVISLIALFWLSKLNVIETIKELLLLSFWFFVWEYGDLVILDRTDLLVQKLEAGQLSSVKVAFLENEDNV